jgi:hypothetical protein
VLQKRGSDVLKSQLRGMLVLTITTIGLSGCSAQGQMVKAAAKERGAQTTDAILQDMLYMKCEGLTAGALVRHYDTPEKARLWWEECGSHGWQPGPPMITLPATAD